VDITQLVDIPPIKKKKIQNVYGDPLPFDKVLKYNEKDINKFMRNNLSFNQEGKCINAYDVICNPVTIKLAYETIKSKAGNMTRGTDRETLDGISLE
jgi:hypothetical protein